MKQSTETRSGVRAGTISLLILILCYLAMTGLSDGPRVSAFMALFAVCLAMMLSSVVDLLVWTFHIAASYSGMALGRSVRFVRRLF